MEVWNTNQLWFHQSRVWRIMAPAHDYLSMQARGLYYGYYQWSQLTTGETWWYMPRHWSVACCFSFAQVWLACMLKRILNFPQQLLCGTYTMPWGPEGHCDPHHRDKGVLTGSNYISQRYAHMHVPSICRCPLCRWSSWPHPLSSMHCSAMVTHGYMQCILSSMGGEQFVLVSL